MPKLLLDKTKCLGNIQKMASRATSHKLSFRPHCKSHQSAEIGNWQRDFGVSKITVSSFQMASYFANAGWEDILVAFPFDPHDISLLNALSENSKISILLDNPDSLAFLDRIDHPTEFYIDIDTGYGRTGIRSEDPDRVKELITRARINPKLKFKGFYCHAGNSYHAKNNGEKNAIHQKSRQDLANLKIQFREYDPMVLYGDTPNCSTRDNFTGIDEITPGNFILYDLMQLALGSCSPEEIAVAMGCPVTGKYTENRRIVIHGGAVHFSKESMSVNGHPVYGKTVTLLEHGWKEIPEPGYITGISQEHGILENPGPLFDRISIGDTLHFLPVHSCLAANLMKEFYTLEGEVIETMNS